MRSIYIAVILFCLTAPTHANSAAKMGPGLKMS